MLEYWKNRIMGWRPSGKISLCVHLWLKTGGEILGQVNSGCPRIKNSLFSTNGLWRAGEPPVLPPLSTSTISVYRAFGTIRGLFIFVKVGARSPRPHLVVEFSDSLKTPDPNSFAFALPFQIMKWL